MTTILGIDAAWTGTEPSGVALVRSEGGGWRCVAAAPSYEAFMRLASGERIDWSQGRFRGTAPDVDRLLGTAQALARSTVDVVTVDMPIATAAFAARRVADDAISREFGSRWCSAHTPNATRPGALGRALSEGFRMAGYPLATAGASGGFGRCLLEVYPTRRCSR